jgi:hypothetical protein
VSGYRLIDHTRSRDIREALQTIDVNSRIKDYEIKAVTARRKTGTKQFSQFTIRLKTQTHRRPRMCNMERTVLNLIITMPEPG